MCKENIEKIWAVQSQIDFKFMQSEVYFNVFKEKSH